MNGVSTLSQELVTELLMRPTLAPSFLLFSLSLSLSLLSILTSTADPTYTEVLIGYYYPSSSHLNGRPRHDDENDGSIR